MRKFISENKDIFADGIGDTLFGLCRLANQLGVDVEEAFNLVKERIFKKYSEKKSETNIVNKDGKLVAFIDDGLRLYEYYGGYLIGWIKPDTNEVVRNFDNSVIGVIEDDFILDETGHAIGSIERSENLRWDREKLFQQIQKKPTSHYFIRIENPIPFNLSPFRYSDWASEKLEDILFFSEKKIQKLK